MRWQHGRGSHAPHHRFGIERRADLALAGGNPAESIRLLTETAWPRERQRCVGTKLWRKAKAALITFELGLRFLTDYLRATTTSRTTATVTKPTSPASSSRWLSLTSEIRRSNLAFLLRSKWCGHTRIWQPVLRPSEFGRAAFDL